MIQQDKNMEIDPLNNGKGIIVYWYRNIEYINFDFANICSTTKINITKEWDCIDKIWRDYNTLSEVRKINNSKYIIKLTYKPEENPGIEPDEVYWGVSSIEIDINSVEGKATWVDHNYSECNGTRNWCRIDQPLIREKRKVTTTKLQRDQAQFRQLLLTIDKKCILTGEDTTEVLEAAHIIPASAGGAEVIGNGIILRSDLHKLYDSYKFDISPSGEILTTDTLAPSYKTILKGKKINSIVLKRIRKALDKKREMALTSRFTRTRQTAPVR
jgi:hypothetical protein